MCERIGEIDCEESAVEQPDASAVILPAETFIVHLLLDSRERSSQNLGFIAG
jgi:hypothetical protein